MIPLRDNIPSRSLPVVNYLLVFLNAAVFLFELTLGRDLEAFIYLYGLVPAVWTHPMPADQLDLLDKLRGLGTSIFLHGGWMHVLSNVWILLIFGDNVEDAFGHLRYLFFYLASGLAAGLLHLLTNWGSPVPTIGASGAIAGVMGAYFILYPHARVVTLVPVFVFLRLVELPAFFFLGLWFLSQLYHGSFSLGPSFGGVAWWAHIGGFVTGVALAGGLRRRRRRF